MLETKTTNDIQIKSSLNIVNWHSALKNSVIDPTVGIKRVPLVGDSILMMGVAELQPGRKVKAHSHSKGVEIFHIIKGEGEICTGFQEDETVIWNNPIKIKGGDVFSIEPGVIHQLSNASYKQSLFLMFSCPLSHICTDIVTVDDFI